MNIEPNVHQKDENLITEENIISWLKEKFNKKKELNTQLGEVLINIKYIKDEISKLDKIIRRLPDRKIDKPGYISMKQSFQEKKDYWISNNLNKLEEKKKSLEEEIDRINKLLFNVKSVIKED